MIYHPLDLVERRPRTCIWEITGACNLRCVHCENTSGERSTRELPIDRMLETAETLARLGCRHVDVTGGEPLLRAGWDGLCRRLADLGMRVALITNGTLLDDEALERAARAGVKIVGVSIDGLQETHDRTRPRPVPGRSPWEEAVEALRRAAPRIETVAVTQVNVQNLGELPALRLLLRELGVRRWQIQLCLPTGRVLELGEPYVVGPGDLEELTAFIASANGDGLLPSIDTSDTIGYYTDREPLLRKRAGGQGLWIGCQAGIRSVAITYEGTVRGCSAMPRAFDAGDLHDEDFETIWNDEGRFAYSTRFDADRLEGDCGDCRFGPLCRAGCTSLAWWAGGTIYANPYCLHRVRGLAR